MNTKNAVINAPDFSAGAVAALAGLEPLPPHLVRLPGGDWFAWRWICLRGAGFSHSLIRKMALPECAAAANEVLATEREADKAREEFVAAVRLQMDITQDRGHRKELGNLLTQVNKGRIPAVQAGPLEQFHQPFSRARERLEDARQHFQQLFQNGTTELSERIREVAADPRFRQAVLLQNRKAVCFALDPLLERPADKAQRSKKDRQSEELVASYLQRYCAKNDSIGFFGPIGWAQFTPGVDGIVARPGPSLIAKSNIYFEQWTIDALAEKLGENPAMRPWIAPRLTPDAHPGDGVLQLPDGKIVPLSPQEKAVLERCVGGLTARQLASALIQVPGGTWRSEEEVFAVLEKFANFKALIWTFTIPVVLHPEQNLRVLLERVGNEELRVSAIEILNRLELLRDQIHQAEGNPVQLDNALAEMETTFTEMTGKPCTRYDGEIYSGRTLVYQDCRRDIEVQVGPDILEELGRPLSLLLAGARWFTYQGAILYRDLFQQIYEEFATATGKATVDLLPFWYKMRPFLFRKLKRPYERLLPEFQKRWGDILRLPDTRRVEYTSAELRSHVQAAFDSPHPGWQLARYHSPDVMIAASSIEDIQRGNYNFVLGEVHIGLNTIRPSFAMAQHPCPEEMLAGVAEDLPGDHVELVPPKSFRRYSGRARTVLVPPQNYFVEMKDDSISWRGPEKTLPITAFVIEPSASGLVVRTRDGRLQFDLIEFFGELLSNEVLEYMDMIAHRPHIPRISIDRLVIQRESWAVSASELHFAHAEEESERFLGAIRWQREKGFPRFVFVRVPVEVKPFYVDFESPVYIEILCKMIRRTVAVKQQLPSDSFDVVEMVPSGDEAWLPDAEGQKYTCEFRVVALDPQDSRPGTLPQLNQNG